MCDALNTINLNFAKISNIMYNTLDFLDRVRPRIEEKSMSLLF